MIGLLLSLNLQIIFVDVFYSRLNKLLQDILFDAVSHRAKKFVLHIR